MKLGVEHPASWERIAVVSDVSWVDHLMKAFGWMIPGDVKLFSVAQLDDAKRWIGE